MKKLLIVLSIFITVITTCAFIVPQDVMVNSNDPGKCAFVKNCTVELVTSGSGYKVKATNNNDYKVTVDYDVWGYAENGQVRKVYSGTLSVPAKNSGNPTYSNLITTSCTDVHLDGIYVTKCD